MIDTFEVPIGNFVISAGGPTHVFTIETLALADVDVESDIELDVETDVDVEATVD